MKVNKILKYIEFITEERSDTPETLMKSKLDELDSAIFRLFDGEATGTEEDEKPETISKGKARDNDRKKKKKLSMVDMGVTLDSHEVSVYSPTDPTLTVKYTDQEGTYDLLISINIGDAVAKDPNVNFTSDDVKKLYVKFKKYTIDDIDLIGQTTHNITVDKDENFEDNGFIFNVPKPKKAQGTQTPPPAQGQEQEQPQAQPAQEEVEKMNLMEFLEFLKIDFDKRYPDNKN